MRLLSHLVDMDIQSNKITWCGIPSTFSFTELFNYGHGGRDTEKRSRRGSREKEELIIPSFHRNNCTIKLKYVEKGPIKPYIDKRGILHR